jgi:hypothetical protein
MRESLLQFSGRRCSGQFGSQWRGLQVLDEAGWHAVAVQQKRQPGRVRSACVAERHENDPAFEEAKELEKKGCKVSSGQLLAALVLRNNYTTPVQIFFYQLSLFRFNTSTAATGWWAPGVLRGGGRTKRFGFRDGLSSFDQAAPSVGTPASYDFDLLPRLREIITKGEHGLDTDVDHWQLRSAYFGQHIWGDVSVSSTWDKIQMRAVLAD